MKIIVRSVPERKDLLVEVLKICPSATVCVDYNKQAFVNFLNALRFSEDAPCLHLEDDIICCDDFQKKIEGIIANHPNEVVQFFSMRKKDLTVGSRYEPGRTFMMNLCFYLPAGMATLLLNFYHVWDKKKIHPTGYDLFMADFFKLNKIKYWLHVPSLVQHRIEVSMIDKRRSKFRQSLTFENYDKHRMETQNENA